MQQRNFVLFMVSSVLVLIGWIWMQNKLWPPKPRAPGVDKTAQKVNWLKFGPAARAANLVANRGLPIGGLLDDIRLAQDLLFTPPPPRRMAFWEDLTEEQRQVAVLVPPP